MQVRVSQPESPTIFRIQRDGPSPAEQAHDALQQELTAQVARLTTEIRRMASEGGSLTAPQRARLAELRSELTATAAQLRQLESQRREHAIEDAAHAMAERAVAGQAGVVVPPPIGMTPQIPREAVDISIAFFVCVAAAIVLFPLMRSIGRILERRAMPPQRLDPEAASQLVRLEQALDAVAIEVERIAEGQRFTAKMLSDREKAAQLPS